MSRRVARRASKADAKRAAGSERGINNAPAAIPPLTVAGPTRVGLNGRQRSVRMNLHAAVAISKNLRAALAGYRRADVTVYDAAGKPIAIIDGETRERREL